MSPVKPFRLLPWALLAACAHAAPAPGAENSATTTPLTLLSARPWHLHKAIGTDGAPDESWLRGADGLAPQLSVGESGDIHVQNLCNFNASPARWQADGSLGVGRGMGTKMACAAPGLLELERRILNLLPTARRWSLQPAQLTLEFKDGTRWLLEGQAIPKDRHGARQEMFLEVSTRPHQHCPHPGGGCLSMREVHFENGQDGRKTHGEWQGMDGLRIEGWQPEPGFRYLLRLHRRPGFGPENPLDGYVLDMVMEVRSERN